MNGDEFVETTSEIINYFNRSGLNGKLYYIHEGIKVCEHGMIDKIMAKEALSMDQVLHGTNEGVIEGR